MKEHACCPATGKDQDPAHHARGGAAAPAKAKDPVCGMTVDPGVAKHKAEHAGATYYFCCAGCRTKFEANPQHYLEKAAAKAPAHAHHGPASARAKAPEAPAGT